MYQDTIEIETEPQEWVVLTGEVNEIVWESGVHNGLCHVFNLGSTGAIIVNENEERLKHDLSRMLKEIAPKHGPYRHPDNSFSHQWATLLGSGETIPVQGSKLALGTWQDVMFYECDVKAREREILVTVQ